MALMVNRDAPYSGLSSLMAMQGRYGDTELVHMSKPEIQGLASLGQLTINPDTGLPEAFSLKSIIPVAGSIIGGMVAGPAGAAIGSGLGTAATGGSTKDILLSAGLSFASGLGMQALTGAPISAFGSTGGLSSLFGGGAEAAVLPQDVIASGMADPLGEGIVSSAIPQATANIPAATQGLASGAGLSPYITDGVLDLDAAMQVPTNIQRAMQAQAGTAAAVQPTAMQTLGGDFAGADFGSFDPAILDTTAAVTPKPSSSLFSQVSEGVSDVGEGISNLYEQYLSPSRQSIQPTQADITKAFEARAAELQLPSVKNLSVAERSKIVEGLKPGFLKKYGPLGAVGIGGLAAADAVFGEEPEEQKLPERKPVDAGDGGFELVGGGVRRPIPTEEEFRRRAVEGGSQRYFEPYRYVRRAAEGGIVGLQQGGMATPQAPSAMSAMLTPPVQQPQPIQPINIAVQPPQQQPQQPQPMTPMGQGPAPLPDQQKEFMKLMDMEEQVQGQRRSDSTQALATIMGLGMNQVTAQYPQTSPSGQAVQPPSPPPMTYGSQVNLGLAGGGQPYFEGQVEGPGDGQSDEVAFRVDGGQVDGAMLSPDEYVLAADVVSAIGNGSSDAGAAKLDQFMKNVRQDAYGTTKQMQPFNNQGLTNLVA